VRRPIQLLLTAVFLLAPAAARAGEPPKPGSLGTALAVVVSAREPGANEAAAALEIELTKAIRNDSRLKPMDLLEVLGGEPQVGGALKPEIEEHFKKGKDAYDNLDLDAAAAEYLEGVKKLLDDPAVVRPTVLARGFTLAGAARLLNGQTDQAASIFKGAAIISPEYAPDPNEFSPDILNAYNDAKGKATSGPKGALTVTSNVTPTLVAVDGLESGVAPLTLKDLPAGRHHVLLKCHGYKPWATFVEVQEGGSGSAAAELHPLPEGDRFRKAVEIASTETTQGKPGYGATELGAALKARYLVLGTAQNATAGTSVEFVTYDLEKQRRGAGVKKSLVPGSPTFNSDVRALASHLVDSLVKPTTLVEEEAAGGAVTDRPWFWPVVGVGAAAVVAGVVAGGVVAASGHRHSTAGLTNGTGIP
jgi:hypothetical protein